MFNQNQITRVRGDVQSNTNKDLESKGPRAGAFISAPIVLRKVSVRPAYHKIGMW